MPQMESWFAHFRLMPREMREINLKIKINQKRRNKMQKTGLTFFFFLVRLRLAFRIYLRFTFAILPRLIPEILDTSAADKIHAVGHDALFRQPRANFFVIFDHRIFATVENQAKLKFDNFAQFELMRIYRDDYLSVDFIDREKSALLTRVGYK